jgi:hypothetical protein
LEPTCKCPLKVGGMQESHNTDKATNTCIEIVNEFTEEVKKVCKLEEDFQQNKTNGKNLLMEIIDGHERNYW